MWKREAGHRSQREIYRCYAADFEDGQRDHKLRKVGGLWRMEKTRDIFKKLIDTKGIFHAKMGTIKDRNDMDQAEAENIKKR